MKRTWVIEWGGGVRNPNPRHGGLWVSRTRADTLETTTEQRHVFWGARWMVTLRWTKALTANAALTGGKAIPSNGVVGGAR
jgi:hypothetical protein